MQGLRTRALTLSGLWVLFGLGLMGWFGSEAQVNVTATPVRGVIVTLTPLPTAFSVATPTPTFTPTPPTAPLLEVISPDSAVNVREAADPTAERLGTIERGEQYPVIGQFFSWYQFEYDRSPTGRAWVYGELVEITGDTSLILDLTVDEEPTVDVAGLNATRTWEAITLTPGIILTATAESRVLAAPTSVNQTGGVAGPAQPTFTFPPDFGSQDRLATQQASQQIATITPEPGLLPPELENVVLQVAQANIPPIVPIIALGSVGLLGLLIQLIRRQ